MKGAFFLAFDPGDPEQGVFFVKGDGSAVRVPEYSRIRPREIIFIVPTLPAGGEYAVELRVKYGGALVWGKISLA